ncbi:MAG: hypothetical protein ACRCZ2_14165 [Fusobacteriaceae bacterium]
MWKKLFYLVIIVFVFNGCFSDSTNSTSKENIGYKLTMAENMIQSKLRDPNSYKRLNYNENRNSDGKITSIRIEYTARNGFGGTNREVETINF